MKIGDTFPVNLAGHEVARARITSMEDGIAVLRFDGAEVKMSYVTQLAPDLEAPVEESTKQVIIDGVDRATPAGESAPVGGEVLTPSVTPSEAAVDVSTSTETPTPEATNEAPKAVENTNAPEGQ